LENTGSGPLKARQLTRMVGASRAVAGDLDGDGDLDIAAVSLLPDKFFANQTRDLKLDGVIVLEQTQPGEFVRHSLINGGCRFANCDIADYDGDGDDDLVAGHYNMPEPQDRAFDWVTVWTNEAGSTRTPDPRAVP
jgi:hypothetical protein